MLKSTDTPDATLRAVNDADVFDVTGLPPTNEPVTGEYRTTRVPASTVKRLVLNNALSVVPAMVESITDPSTTCLLHAPEPASYGLVLTITDP